MTRIGNRGKRMTMTIRRGACGAAALAWLIVPVEPALAHHVMDGNLPTVWWQGALSGLAHPIIGLDHLAFMLAAALLVIRQRMAPLMLAAFVLASTVGVFLHLALFNLPAVEPAIAVSVLIFGLGVAMARSIGAAVMTALLVAGGIYHGYAFGESIVGAERSPLAGYLIGLAVIQYLVMLGTLLLARYIGMPLALPMAYRGAGAAIALVGLTMLGMMAA